MNHELDGIAKEIESKKQNEDQFCNNYASIFLIPEKEDLKYDDEIELVKESDFNFGDYVLETGDNSSWTDHEKIPYHEKLESMTTEEIEKYLIGRIEDWIFNTDEDPRIEKCRWGLATPEDFEVENPNVECVIVEEGCFNGYGPTNFVMDNDDISPMVFENQKAAETWIAENTSGTYYLSHNEAGRPSYMVWEYEY